MGLLLAAGSNSVTLLGASPVASIVSSSQLILTKPSGVAAGDLLIAFMCGDSSAAWTGDTGWTELIDGRASVGLPGVRVAYKIATGSEGSSYTFTCSQTTGSGVILAYRNAAVDVTGSAAGASFGDVVATSITLSADGLLLGFFAHSSGSRSFTAPSGMSLIAEDTDSAQPSFALFGQEVTAGATGSRTSTPSFGGGASGVLIGIKGA
jgi:hypothetical protein